MSPELLALLLAAIGLGFVHTLLGPDHYLPFVVLGRARGWRLPRTLAVTALCGAGHVAGSVLLGGLAVALGWAALRAEGLETWRGGLAGWLLLGFGVAYTAWGVRRAVRRRPHSHWHAHDDGTVHRHTHVHHGGHAHLHEAGEGAPGRLTAWTLFLVFVLGPCEPLIPLLLYPAAGLGWPAAALVAAVFGLVTVVTMTALVAAGHLGLSRLPLGRAERWSHALAGLALTACGVALQLGW